LDPAATVPKLRLGGLAARAPVEVFEFDFDALVMPAQPVRIANEANAATNRAGAEPQPSLCFAPANAFRIKVQQSALGPVIMTDYELTRNGCYWPPGQTEDRLAACPSPRDIWVERKKEEFNADQTS
jgi:hypothetical protein